MRTYGSKISLRLLVSLLAGLVFVGVFFLNIRFTERVAAQPSQCSTSSDTTDGYTITLCITSPTSGAVLSGTVPVAITYTISHPGVPVPGVQKIVYELNSYYILTAYQSPFSFSFPTAKFMDVGNVPLSAELYTNDDFVT